MLGLVLKDVGLIGQRFWGLTSGDPKLKRNPIYRTASLGGQQVLPCEVVRPFGFEGELDFVVTWRKGSLPIHRTLLTKVDGYSPTRDDEYKERLEIVNRSSLQISHIEQKDQDWYQCSISIMKGPTDTPTNDSWIYLTVNSPPQITNSSGTLINMDRGESVTLFCEGHGFPEPKISWMKDGHPLNNTIRTTIGSDEVKIVNLQREDGGIYTCTFTNIVGDRSQPIKLVIQGGPYIMTQPGNQTVLEGQRVNFPCGTEGYPNIISHTWLKDQIDVRLSDGVKAFRITILTDGSLVIKTAVKTDKGWYMCRASNGLGHDEASAYLNVVYKPVVLPLPTQLIWAKGYRQQIDCPVDSNPPLNHIIWVKDNEQLQSKGRFDILHNGTLLVSDVMDIDSGSYSCTPENAMGHGLSSNRVQVIVKDPPQITKSPQLLYIRKVGDSVTMNCEATGTPAVSLQWIKVDGKLDSNNNRFKITDQFLEIRNLTKDDHGKYECRAINTIATVVSVTELRIDNTTPHAPYNVTVVPDLLNVTISWQPAYDGGTRQLYVIWFRQISQFQWETIALPGEAVTYFKLYRLQPDTDYEFKILSRNSFGNGSFSDVVRQRTLGYSPKAVNVLPTNDDGIPYYPDINNDLGPLPSPPYDVTAQVKDRNIALSWRTPSFSPVPIFSYKIEYKLDGTWKVYHTRFTGNTTTSAVMTNMPLGTYEVFVRSYGVLARSSLINPAHVLISGDDVVIPQAMVGGIIGGVLFLLVAILLALVAVFYSRRKERKAKEKKYDDVNYGKPDEINGRHHESAPKRDRWQHNGGGDLVTSLNNTDSIFFLPQSHSHDQSASSMMRPLILLDRRHNDMDSLFGRGVADGKWHDKDHGRSVPLTNETSFMSNKSLPGVFKSQPDQTELDVRNLTWPNQQHDAGFEPQSLSRSLHTRIDPAPASYGFDYSHPQELLQQSPVPQSYPPLYKSHSVPSHYPNKRGHFPPLASQYPSHSIHMPPSYPSHYVQPHPVYSISQPSSPQGTPLDPALSSLRQNRPRPNSDEYPSFQSQSLPPLSHHQAPGFPRHSSMKPSHMTYLIDGDEEPYPDTLSELKDISSVLDPSQIQPTTPQDVLPSSNAFNRSSIGYGTSIPGYYMNTSHSSKAGNVVTPNQFNSPSTVGSVRSPTFSPSQSLGDIQHTPKITSLEPQSRLSLQHNISGLSDPFPHSKARPQNYPTQFSQSHSNLRTLNDYSTLDSNDSRKPELMDEAYYHYEPTRPRALSEGSRGRKHQSYLSDDHSSIDQERPPYSSASYPDMALQDETTLSGQRDRHYPHSHRYHHSRDPSVQQHGDQMQNQPLYHHPQQQSSIWPAPDRTVASFHQRSPASPTPVAQRLSPRDAIPPMHIATQKHGFPGSLYRDQTRHHYGDDIFTPDFGSHSSGIGSRNTSQSTGSYHQHRRGSAGKGSASFSSGQGHDISLDVSAGTHGLGHPNHRRDMSGDENYEFDSLNAIENDIMDDIRRYSQLTGGSGNASYSRGIAQQDPSVPHPSKPSQYPDSERRFEKLREEFKQYRQQQYDPSEVFQLPPTATAVLPIGINGEPLYPMDSEML